MSFFEKFKRNLNFAFGDCCASTVYSLMADYKKNLALLRKRNAAYKSNNKENYIPKEVGVLIDKIVHLLF